MGAKQQGLSILMLPWLAHGHISPFLELAKRLSQRNFHIYFCSTPINLNPITELNLPSIQLVELILPSAPEFPPHYHTTRNLPPHLMSTLKTAFDSAQPEFSNILKTLKPNIVIYDLLQPWVPEVARQHNIKAVLSLSCSAASASFLFYFANHLDQSNPGYPISAIDFPKNEREKMIQFMHISANGVTDTERFTQSLIRSFEYVLIRTSRMIESQYIDFLGNLVGKEIIPVGHFVEHPVCNAKSINNHNTKIILEFLNNKGPSSTVFVSFGSEYFLSDEEFKDIAEGLELSKVAFIWAVRVHVGENKTAYEATMTMAEEEGFLQRAGERGLVVEGWAPQAQILDHPSTGGFVSHCGWSSALEAMASGVPIIAVPMQLDQPLNARLVGEIGAGVEVRRRGGEALGRVIREVVVGEEGGGIRKKAKEMRERLREEKGEETEIDVLVKKLVELVAESRHVERGGGNS